MDSLTSLLQNPRLQVAAAHGRATDAETLADQIALTAIPAPPFGEDARGEAMAERFRSAGLAEVRTDAVGNVLGVRPGTEELPPVILSAHLDTVFGEGVSIQVTRQGDRVAAPGISDDGRGLAVILAVARALEAGEVVTRRPILFAATVGEEGLGDLRGAKQLVGPDGAGHDAAAFITVDGAGLDRVVTAGLGSRRFRVHVRGGGGHSWVDRGLANPIHALGRMTAALSRAPVPSIPDSALTVSRWGGGTSINAIPQEAWLEIDARSTDEHQLHVFEELVRETAAHAVEDERLDRRGLLQVQVERIGVRPAGVTAADSLLVQAAWAATEAVGVRAAAITSSTDANAAMAVGIPGISFGGGGEAGLAHTTAEWYHNARGSDGVVRALFAIYLVASA